MGLREKVEQHLPLRPVEFQILVSLSQGRRHGYGIIQDAERRGEGGAVPGLATLYRAMRRLAQAGLIESCDPPSEAPSEEERRQYFKLTALGKEVAVAEASRLEKLVGLARDADLLKRPAQ